MNGGNYQCDNCGYTIAHFSSETAASRMACIRCDGWMHPIEPEPYKKPNIIWVGIAHVIWFFLKPISNWLDKKTEKYQNHDD